MMIHRNSIYFFLVFIPKNAISCQAFQDILSIMYIALKTRAFTRVLKNTYFCVRYYNNNNVKQQCTKMFVAWDKEKNRVLVSKTKCQRNKENDACSRYGWRLSRGRLEHQDTLIPYLYAIVDSIAIKKYCWLIVLRRPHLRHSLLSNVKVN